MNGEVSDLTVFDGTLIVAGTFTIAGDKVSAYFARWTLGACEVSILTGDVNVSGTISSTDIIYLADHVFKGGPDPQPCVAAGE